MVVIFKRDDPDKVIEWDRPSNKLWVGGYRSDKFCKSSKKELSAPCHDMAFEIKAMNVYVLQLQQEKILRKQFQMRFQQMI